MGDTLYRHRRASQFLTDRVEAESVLLKDLGCHALFFTKDSQQQMSGSSVPVVQALRLFGRIGKNALALIRHRQVEGGRNFLADCNSAFDLLSDAFDRRVISEKTIGQVLVLLNQPQQ